MTFFRSYIAPFLIVLTFLVAMVAVSARIFLPSDMMAPAPVEEESAAQPTDLAFEPESAPRLLSRQTESSLADLS